MGASGVSNRRSFQLMAMSFLRLCVHVSVKRAVHGLTRAPKMLLHNLILGLKTVLSRGKSWNAVGRDEQAAGVEWGKGNVLTTGSL